MPVYTVEVGFRDHPGNWPGWGTGGSPFEPSYRSTIQAADFDGAKSEADRRVAEEGIGGNCTAIRLLGHKDREVAWRSLKEGDERGWMDAPATDHSP